MRLIDADEILRKCNGGNCWYIPREAIEEEPTVDAVPIKHGRWEDSKYVNVRKCSCCQAEWGIYSIEDFDFCPSCGADMRGETEMTREEAIDCLEGLKIYLKTEHIDQEAVDMAIEALQSDPVKHGKWKYYNYSDISNPYVGLYECTVCKQHEHSERKYCPNCGAKMDG